MWCRSCQQDVPAAATVSGDSLRCPRCQQALSGGATQTITAPFEPLAGPARGAAQMKIERTLRAARQRASDGPTAPVWRFDTSESTSHTSSQQSAARVTSAPQREPRSLSQFTAWALACIGAALLGGGIGLAGWSLIGARPDLWRWALGALLSGQGLLLVGVVQMLASLWGNSRGATARLTLLQQEVSRLQRTTDSLVGLRTASATTFYADLARGASPDTLLANLKGQIDALANRVNAD